MKKENDILTLLNLACYKHTGCLLPINDYGGNNWKYELEFMPNPCDDEYGKDIKKAKWSPHPYFNPLHLYYPSYDFGARVLRSLVVSEINFIRYGETEIKKQLKKIINPFGYADACHGGVSWTRAPPVKVLCSFHPNSKPSKIQKLFLTDLFHTGGPMDTRLPFCGITDPREDRPRNQHHLRTEELDKRILRGKQKQRQYDILTQSGKLRKKGNIAKDISDILMISIGMSSTHDAYFVKKYRLEAYQLRRMIREEQNAGRPHLRKQIGEYFTASELLQPQDFVEIYNPSSIDKKEKINQKLIANFPPTQTD